jgi:hypothetical protein
MDENTDSKLYIRGIDADGNAPKRRVYTVSAAMTAYQSMTNSQRVGGRDTRFAVIAGQFAGFPPIPPAEMGRMGMGDMPNVNTREFESSVRNYADIWNSINCGNLEWAEVDAEHEDPMEAERRGKYLTECFNWALQIWNDPPDKGFFNHSGKYILESSIRDLQMALFDVGVSMWRDSIDFRFTTIPTRKFLIPEGTKISLENCPAFCVQDDMSAAQLWRMRDKKGWNKEQIEKLLYYNQGARGQLSQDRSTYAQWVQWVRENESFVMTDFTPVPFIHIFTQEFSGKISHSCFSTDTAQGELKKKNKNKPKEEMGPDDFLYDAPESEWADSWDQVVALFTDSVDPEGRYHGCKGFGDRNSDMCQFGDLMFNQTARSAIMANMVMFQSSNEGDRQKMNEIVFTPGAILFPEVPIAQLNLKVDIGAAMGIYDLATRTRNINNRIAPIGERNKAGETKTATEVTTDTAKEAQFTGLQVSHYRATGLDKLLAEMYRRIAQPGSAYPESWPGGKVAKRFREKCKEFGIEEKDLLKVKRVRANRNGGSGSMPIDLMKAKELLAVATPGKGQWNARYEVAAALKGAEMALSFVEPLPDQPTDLTRRISDENLFIQDGKSPLVLPNDAHEVHVPAHVQLLGELQKVVVQFQEQGITPDNIDDAVLLKGKLDAGIEHTGAHVQYMSEIPRGKAPALFEDIVKETTKALNALMKMSEAFGEEIAVAAQESQQAQQAQSPEMMKAQVDAQVKMLLAQAEIERKNAAHEAKLGNMAVQAQARTDMKTAAHELDMGLKAEQTVAQMEQSRAQAQEKMMEDAARSQQDLAAQGASKQIDIAAQAAKAVISNQPKPETK